MLDRLRPLLACGTEAAQIALHGIHAGIHPILESDDDFDEMGHMIFGILMLPVAFLLLGLSVQKMVVELWAEGAIQAFLLLVALPMVVWITCSAIREWWATRHQTGRQS